MIWGSLNARIRRRTSERCAGGLLNGLAVVCRRLIEKLQDRCRRKTARTCRISHDHSNRPEPRYLFLRALPGRLDAIPTLDHIGLETYRTRSAMQLEEKTAWTGG